MMNPKILIPLLMAFPFASAQAGDGALDLGLAAGATLVDDLEVLGSSPSFTVRAGYWFNETIAAELDFGIATGMTQVGTPDPYPFMSMTPRLNLVGKVWQDEPVNLLFVAGFGVWNKSIDDGGALNLPQGTGSDLDWMGNAGPGINVPLSDAFSIRTDLRWMLSMGGENWMNHGDAFMNWELTGGVMLLLGGPKDSDDDGIVDDEDSCIEEAEDIDGFEDHDGCPDTDNDGDGLADVDDSCPDEAEDVDNFEDEDGCAEPDNDEDGILDADDDCPLDTGVASANGCPDADEDGIADGLDECEREKGPESAHGCPDSDKDTIPDYRDACAEEAGPVGASPYRSNGCNTQVYPTEAGLVVTRAIEWTGTRGKWKSSSNLLVDDIYQVAKGVQSLTKLEIQVTSDGEKGDEKALALAQTRADALLAYIDNKGDVGGEEGRVTAKAVEREVKEGEEVADDAPNTFIAALEKNEITMRKKKYEDAPEEEEAPEEAPAEEGKDEGGE